MVKQAIKKTFLYHFWAVVSSPMEDEKIVKKAEKRAGNYAGPSLFDFKSFRLGHN